MEAGAELATDEERMAEHAAAAQEATADHEVPHQHAPIAWSAAIRANAAAFLSILKIPVLVSIFFPDKQNPGGKPEAMPAGGPAQPKPSQAKPSCSKGKLITKILSPYTTPSKLLSYKKFKREHIITCLQKLYDKDQSARDRNPSINLQSKTIKELHHLVITEWQEGSLASIMEAEKQTRNDQKRKAATQEGSSAKRTAGTAGAASSSSAQAEASDSNAQLPAVANNMASGSGSGAAGDMAPAIPSAHADGALPAAAPLGMNEQGGAPGAGAVVLAAAGVAAAAGGAGNIAGAFMAAAAAGNMAGGGGGAAGAVLGMALVPAGGVLHGITLQHAVAKCAQGVYLDVNRIPTDEKDCQKRLHYNLWRLPGITFVELEANVAARLGNDSLEAENSRDINKKRADLVVNKELVVELKCRPGTLRAVDKGQIRTYLQLSRCDHGLLINFTKGSGSNLVIEILRFSKDAMGEFGEYSFDFMNQAAGM